MNEWVGALKERNFRLFFLGQTASQIGTGMAPVAITFAVLRHGTASDVGFVSAAGLAPVVILILVGGVLADRLSRRVVMLTSDAMRTLSELGLGAWILLGSPPLWGFMVLAAVVGIGSAFFNPAMTGLVPQVVSEDRLLQANALNSLSGSIASIIGPAVAGIIIAVASPGWAVFIDGVTYAVSVVSLYLISIEWVASEALETFLDQLRGGLDRVLVAHLALGDRGRVLLRERVDLRAGVRARTSHRQGVARRRCGAFRPARSIPIPTRPPIRSRSSASA